MPLKVDLRTYRMLSPVAGVMDDFSGGLNYRDYPNNDPIDLNQAINVHINGKVISATRDSTDFFVAVAGRTVKDAWWTDVLGCSIARCDDGNFYNIDTGAAIAGAPNVGATSCWLLDFNGLLVLGSRTAGIYTCTSGGVWTLATNAIKPAMLAAWQNKVWAIGDPAFPDRFWASNPGNPGVWTTGTDFNEIPEGGTRGLTCIVATQEQDFQGRPSLIVYKRRSAFRINSANATTGFTYTVLGIGTGCIGRRAACADLGVVVAVDDTGIWKTDGVTAPIKISGKMDPLFGPPMLPAITASATDCDSLVSCTSRYGKFYFSYLHPTASLGCVNLLIWDKLTGAFTIYNAKGGLLDFRTLYRDTGSGGDGISIFCLDGVANSNHQWRVDDNQALYQTNLMIFETAFFNPLQSKKVTFRRLQLEAQLVGQLNLSIKPDWQDTVKRTYAVQTLANPNPGIKPYIVPELGRWKSVSLFGIMGQELYPPGAAWGANLEYPPGDSFSGLPFTYRPTAPMEIHRLTYMIGTAGRS